MYKVINIIHIHKNFAPKRQLNSARFRHDAPIQTSSPSPSATNPTYPSISLSKTSKRRTLKTFNSSTLHIPTPPPTPPKQPPSTPKATNKTFHIAAQQPAPNPTSVPLPILLPLPLSPPTLTPTPRTSHKRLKRRSGSSPQRGQSQIGVQHCKPWKCGRLAGPRGWAAKKSGQVRRLRSGVQGWWSSSL